MLTGIYGKTGGCQRSVKEKLTRIWNDHSDSYLQGIQETVTVVSEKSAIQNITKEVKKDEGEKASCCTLRAARAGNDLCYVGICNLGYCVS